MVTKFVGQAPIDVLWVSDGWLPEWAEAAWLAPLDGYAQLLKYNDEVQDFCTRSMCYKGRQYGLTYYADLHGVPVRRRQARQGGHRGAACDVGRTGRAIAEDQECGSFAIPADALDGMRNQGVWRFACAKPRGRPVRPCGL
jgi:hypothetical protein